MLSQTTEICIVSTQRVVQRLVGVTAKHAYIESWKKYELLQEIVHRAFHIRARLEKKCIYDSLMVYQEQMVRILRYNEKLCRPPR